MDKLRKIIRKIILENDKLGFEYTAVLIEKPSELQKIKQFVEQYVPKDADWIAPPNYHMTISLGKLPQSLYLRGDLNKEVTLTITSIGISENAIALGTTGYYSKNEQQHITLAFHKGSAPVESNNIKNWEKIDQTKITGTIRELIEYNHE